MTIVDSAVRLHRIACLAFVCAVVLQEADGARIPRSPLARTERAERARTTLDTTPGLFVGQPTDDFPQETFGTDGARTVTARIADAFTESRRPGCDGSRFSNESCVSVKRVESDGSKKSTTKATWSVDRGSEAGDDVEKEEKNDERNGTTGQPRCDEGPRAGWRCDNVLSTLSFWGASMTVLANAIYIFPYLIVVFFYVVVPGSRARAYDRAVISYNVSQIFLNVILIGIGFSVLCHTPITPIVFRPLGLAIMFLTISSTFWLVVISFDMTLAITRFRVARSTAPSLAGSREEERKKFRTYAAWSWGGAFVPTAFVCVVESLPTSFLSETSPVRANFEAFDRGVNLSLILYVVGLPLLACLANTGLFCYTTYKMILIRRSTALATASSTAGHEKTLGRRYILFLRLYLLMDTPWFTSGLAAAFPDLWILKFLRMIQPMLMLLAILPSQPISRAFPCFAFTRN